MCKGPADPLSTCSTVSHTEAESSLEFASIWFLPTIESLYCVEKKFRTLNTPLTNINFRKPICRAASSVQWHNMAVAHPVLNIQEYTPRIFYTMNKIMDEGYSCWLGGSVRSAAPARTSSPQTPPTSPGRAAPPSPLSGQSTDESLMPHVSCLMSHVSCLRSNLLGTVFSITRPSSGSQVEQR